jgi:flagellar hook protein FlgE
MLDVMSQAQNAIEAYSEALKASSANIANMNVPGYKRIGVSFQSVFEKVLSRGTAAEGGAGGTNPRQLGQGMALAQTTIDLSAGDMTTGSALDLAISGSGFFIVSPDGGSSFLYTRAGNFEINASGTLTSNGLPVYGLDDSGNVVPITNLPSGNSANYKWLPNGTLQYTADPSVTPPVYIDTGYHIALTYFANPSGLTQAQGTSFAETLASGSAAAAQGPGGAVGVIKPGLIEQSNVFFLAESIASLELQRALSANLSVIKLASDLVSSFIQKLG